MPRFQTTLLSLARSQWTDFRPWAWGSGWVLWAERVVLCAVVVLAALAVAELVLLPFRTTVGQSIFRLAVVNAKGERAGVPHLLARWAIVWLPVLLPMSIVTWVMQRTGTPALVCGLVLLAFWVCAAVYAVVVPRRGLQDRLAGTCVVKH